ncbi:MAG: DUF72 domain-containing protein [Endomicrobiales bacterium]|nr:DUF72 domain-containing protein [Endomicrobiales bacterium]
MIKVGTSGFSFPDWRGTVYPKKLQPKDALIYYQDELGFDCVEINSTYYTLVSQKSFIGMESKTGPDFEFVVKAYRGITHDPFDTRLKDKKPGIKEAKENIKKFVYSVMPLKEKNKLGAVLMQFPVFFYPNEESKDYILDCKEKFSDIPLVIEFRNKAWAKPETFDFLKKSHLGYCIVDEPKLPRLMPFINEVTSDISYLRFHGRNTNWFNAPLSERYDYLYSDKELKSFLPEIEKLNKNSKKTFLFFNNCHAGSAAKNARTLKDLLGLNTQSGKLL